MSVPEGPDGEATAAFFPHWDDEEEDAEEKEPQEEEAGHATAPSGPATTSEPEPELQPEPPRPWLTQVAELQPDPELPPPWLAPKAELEARPQPHPEPEPETPPKPRPTPEPKPAQVVDIYQQPRSTREMPSTMSSALTLLSLVVVAGVALAVTIGITGAAGALLLRRIVGN